MAHVQDWIDDGRLDRAPDGTRNPLQTVPLLDSIVAAQFDAVFGGGRRDEERARAKERIISLRDAFGRWDPRSQRPELWNLYNGRHAPGEHVRVFPISNWTELDVWRYIQREDIELPSIYFATSARCSAATGCGWPRARGAGEAYRASAKMRGLYLPGTMRWYMCTSPCFGLSTIQRGCERMWRRLHMNTKLTGYAVGSDGRTRRVRR